MGKGKKGEKRDGNRFVPVPPATFSARQPVDELGQGPRKQSS